MLQTDVINLTCNVFMVAGGTPCPTTTPTPYGGEFDPYGSVTQMHEYGKGFPPFWPPFWWWKWHSGFPYGQKDQHGIDTELPYGPRPIWVRLNESSFICRVKKRICIMLRACDRSVSGNKKAASRSSLFL